MGVAWYAQLLPLRMRHAPTHQIQVKHRMADKVRCFGLNMWAQHVEDSHDVRKVETLYSCSRSTSRAWWRQPECPVPCQISFSGEG